MNQYIRNKKHDAIIDELLKDTANGKVQYDNCIAILISHGYTIEALELPHESKLFMEIFKREEIYHYPKNRIEVIYLRNAVQYSQYYDTPYMLVAWKPIYDHKKYKDFERLVQLASTPLEKSLLILDYFNHQIPEGSSIESIYCLAYSLEQREFFNRTNQDDY